MHIIVIEPVGGGATELRLRNCKICGLLSYWLPLSNPLLQQLVWLIAH